jgi:hypothetical protein
MRGKPIAEIQHHGKRVRIDFAHQKRGGTIRYDVVVDGEPVLSAVFAEEVMRWLADAMHEDGWLREPRDQMRNMVRFSPDAGRAHAERTSCSSAAFIGPSELSNGGYRGAKTESADGIRHHCSATANRNDDDNREYLRRLFGL